MLVRLSPVSMAIADACGIAIGDYGEVVPALPMDAEAVARVAVHGPFSFVRFRTSKVTALTANSSLRKIDGELRRPVEWDWRGMLAPFEVVK